MLTDKELELLDTFAVSIINGLVIHATKLSPQQRVEAAYGEAFAMIQERRKVLEVLNCSGK